MNCLEMCILVMVTGFTVLGVAFGIIQKLFDESRKKAERAANELNKCAGEITTSITGLVNTISEKVKETRKEREEEFECRMKGEFEG